MTPQKKNVKEGLEDYLKYSKEKKQIPEKVSREHKQTAERNKMLLHDIKRSSLRKTEMLTRNQTEMLEMKKHSKSNKFLCKVDQGENGVSELQDKVEGL